MGRPARWQNSSDSPKAATGSALSPSPGSRPIFSCLSSCRVSCPEQAEIRRSSENRPPSGQLSRKTLPCELPCGNKSRALMVRIPLSATAQPHRFTPARQPGARHTGRARDLDARRGLVKLTEAGRLAVGQLHGGAKRQPWRGHAVIANRLLRRCRRGFAGPRNGKAGPGC